MINLSGEYIPSPRPRVVFGQGAVARLPDELERLGVKRALVLSGRTVAESTDAVSRTVSILGDTCVGVYSGLTMRAPLPAAMEATRLAIDSGADCLVGIGGSTISDAAAMIAALVARNISDAEGVRELTAGHPGRIVLGGEQLALPAQISIPTTLSAGEFNVGGGNVLDPDSGAKIRISHPDLGSDLVVLDPKMTVGTPDWLGLSTGIKTLDHAIERLYCKGNQPMLDAPLLSATELIFRYLPESREEHADLDARLQCQIAAWLSMAGQPNGSFGLSHVLGRELGVRHDVPHGYTSCVTQPFVMEYNRPRSVGKQAMFARAAAGDTRGLSDEAAAIQGARAVDRLIAGLGMPHRIRDVGVPEGALPDLAASVVRAGGSPDNPVPITTEDQVMEVLRKAW